VIDFKFQDGKVLKWKSDHTNEMPMFSQYALQPLRQIYQAVSQASISVGLGSILFGNTFSKSTVKDTCPMTKQEDKTKRQRRGFSLEN
jgi:hypothetical protein